MHANPVIIFFFFFTQHEKVKFIGVESVLTGRDNVDELGLTKLCLKDLEQMVGHPKEIVEWHSCSKCSPN